jgi:hypothetical protein
MQTGSKSLNIMKKDISDNQKAVEKEAEKKLTWAVKLLMTILALLLLWVVGRGVIMLSDLASSLM